MSHSKEEGRDETACVESTCILGRLDLLVAHQSATFTQLEALCEFLCPLPSTPPTDCHQLQADNLEATEPMATLKSALKLGAVDAAIEACKAGGKKIELRGQACLQWLVLLCSHHAASMCQRGGLTLMHTTACDDEVAIAVAAALKSTCSHVTHVTLRGGEVRAMGAAWLPPL